MTDSTKIGEKLAPYNPTNYEAIDIAINLLKIKPNDILFDLGCGDARFLVKACQIDASIRGFGIEYDHAIYCQAVNNVKANGMSQQIAILHDNVLNIDINEATALFIYLVPEGMAKLKDKLVELLSKGARIVTYVFSIPGVEPAEVVIYKSSTKLYLY